MVSMHELVLALVHFLILLIGNLTSLLDSYVARFIQRNSFGSLRKLPVHLALVITEDSVSFLDVGQVVAWCISLGIKNVTLYDHKGIIKENEQELRCYVDAARAKEQSSRLTKYVLKPSGNKSNQNGFVFVGSGDDTAACQVNILSWCDGKQDIVSVTRLLAESAKRSPERSQVTIRNLEDCLHSNCDIPCPDVLICCGETFASVGFLPWHIHLTEIFYLPTHCGVSRNSFFNILAKFGTCQQRYGK